MCFAPNTLQFPLWQRTALSAYAALLCQLQSRTSTFHIKATWELVELNSVDRQFPEQVRSYKHPSGKNKLSKGFLCGKCFEYKENHINAKNHCIYSRLKGNSVTTESLNIKKIIWNVIANELTSYNTFRQIHWPPSCPLTSLCVPNGCPRERTEQPCVHAATGSACSGPHQCYFWNGSPCILYWIQGGFGRPLLLLNFGKSNMM